MTQTLSWRILSVRSAPLRVEGLGVLYWEPEAYNNWKGYTLWAFDNSRNPIAALDAFSRRGNY